jgi:Tfp pilus assembly protein PilO
MTAITFGSLVPWLALLLSLLHLMLIGVAVPVVGYLVRLRDQQLQRHDKRLGVLEQQAARSDESIAHVREDVQEINGKLDRVLERLPARREPASTRPK